MLAVVRWVRSSDQIAVPDWGSPKRAYMRLILAELRAILGSPF